MKPIKQLLEELNKINQSLNEGMWESPIKMEHVPAIKEFFANEVTAKQMMSDEYQSKYWNVFGDDEFWDEMDDLEFDDPEDDVRYRVASYLRDWIEAKDTFAQGAYEDKAAKEIEKIIKNF